MGYLNRFENKPDLDFINLYSRLICFHIKRPSEKYLSDGLNIYVLQQRTHQADGIFHEAAKFGALLP